MRNTGPTVLAYLLARIGQPELAEDLCQETFVKAFQHWHTRNITRHPLPWLCRIARNTLIDELRRPAYRQVLPLIEGLDIAEPVSLENQLELGVAVRAALRQLPQHERTPLLMQALGGCRLREIARYVGCSENALKSRLFRTRARFQQLYAAS